jgi:L-ribulose-5-phosphate 3-epimerase UlaE
VSEWLLLTPNEQFFNCILYHGENKLIQWNDELALHYKDQFKHVVALHYKDQFKHVVALHYKDQFKHVSELALQAEK